MDATSVRSYVGFWMRGIGGDTGVRWKKGEVKNGRGDGTGWKDGFVCGVGRCRRENLCGRDPSRECAAGARRGCREVADEGDGGIDESERAR